MTQSGLEVSSGKGVLGESDSQDLEARKEMAYSRNCRSITLRVNWRLEAGAGLGSWAPKVCECRGGLEGSEQERDCPPGTAPPPPGPLGPTCTGRWPPTPSGHGTLSPAGHVPLGHDRA